MVGDALPVYKTGMLCNIVRVREDTVLFEIAWRGTTEQIDRGYENIDERLRAIGAKIGRIK